MEQVGKQLATVDILFAASLGFHSQLKDRADSAYLRMIPIILSLVHCCCCCYCNINIVYSKDKHEEKAKQAACAAPSGKCIACMFWSRLSIKLNPYKYCRESRVITRNTNDYLLSPSSLSFFFYLDGMHWKIIDTYWRWRADAIKHEHQRQREKESSLENKGWLSGWPYLLLSYLKVRIITAAKKRRKRPRSASWRSADCFFNRACERFLSWPLAPRRALLSAREQAID